MQTPATNVVVFLLLLLFFVVYFWGPEKEFAQEKEQGKCP